MVFSQITADGGGEENGRHASSGGRVRRFCIDLEAPPKSVIRDRTAEVEALAGSTENWFRTQLNISAQCVESGELDEARQRLLEMVFDPSLPATVIRELAAALSRVDLARFSLSLCERLIESESENAELAYDLAAYTSMCGKPQYVTEMYLMKAYELSPFTACYRLSLITWLLSNRRNAEAVAYSNSPDQLDWSLPVCSDCLAWSIRKFSELGSMALANAWQGRNSASIRNVAFVCCRNFRGPSESRRAW
jgi:hypothetical protein